ncbi:PH domain-containing protein [Streptomyces sp. BBFR2]|uniref:PH domain-containing protein n=1 Tax=Streptomyces sp. BBFR2 TaxID=3372854 RepID=UPI0037DA3A9B
MPGSGTAPPPPAAALRPPRHRVDPRARRWWTARALLMVSGPALLTAAALTVCALLLLPGTLPWLAPPLAALTVAALVHTALMPRVRYAVHAWELGERAVYASDGWYRQRRRIAPLSRVQTVDTVRGPLERRFGLATVTVTTASTAGDIRIRGLSDAAADALSRRIGAAAQLVPGDAA